jgi:hypothetical protein
MRDILVTVSDQLKAKLDLKKQAEGITIKNYINAVLERELADKPTPRRKGRKAAQ